VAQVEVGADCRVVVAEKAAVWAALKAVVGLLAVD